MQRILIAAGLLILSSIALCFQTNSTIKASQIVLPSNFQPPPSFRNINLVHTINLEKSFPRHTVNIVIENVAGTAEDEYFLPFTSEQMKRLGALEVRDRNHLDEGTFEVQAVEPDPERETQFYIIRLPKPLSPKSQLTMGISFSYISAFHPKPRAIPQSGNQFLEYEFSAYAPSSYVTLKQKSDIKFPNSNVLEYTIVSNGDKNNQSPSKVGSKFTYGPFDEVPGGAFEPVKVRYQFTKPLIHISKLERDIEISHWGGNVAFEERYSLTNRAANLSKLFSRVEWASTTYYNPPTTAIKELKVPLKVGSSSPYFIDVIGNVSTSRFRSNRNEASLELKPRYPVFGGWNYPFRIGWNIDLKKYLRKLSSGSSYVLNVPFLEGPKQDEGVEYEMVELRIILPEGAENLNYSTTVPFVSANISLYKTYMDTLGRTTLTLTVANIFDDLRDRELIVTYNYPLRAALRKPLVFFSGFLGLFVAAWVMGSFDMSIRGKPV